MIDYEYMILDMAEDDGGVADDCTSCPYKGEKCRTQCEDVIEIYNPYIQKMLDELRGKKNKKTLDNKIVL